MRVGRRSDPHQIGDEDRLPVLDVSEGGRCFAAGCPRRVARRLSEAHLVAAHHRSRGRDTYRTEQGGGERNKDCEPKALSHRPSLASTGAPARVMGRPELRARRRTCSGLDAVVVRTPVGVLPRARVQAATTSEQRASAASTSALHSGPDRIQTLTPADRARDRGMQRCEALGVAVYAPGAHPVAAVHDRPGAIRPLTHPRMGVAVRDGSVTEPEHLMTFVVLR
jgi:hypothetical protein